jgi:Putative transposase, YhgA-like
MIRTLTEGYGVDARRAASYNRSGERSGAMADARRQIPDPPSGPESIREFEDRSAQWLFEDPENVGGLLQIRDPDLAEQLDFTRAERVNRTFVPANLRKKESDLIFRVPFRADTEEGGREVWVYVLVEHQSEPDPLMGLRLYLYMGNLWDLERRQWARRRIPRERRRLHPIIPIIFYTGEQRWEVPIGLANLMDLPAQCERFIPRWETLMLPLHETLPETLTRFATAVGWALRVWQAEKVPLAEIERVLTEAMTGLEGLSEEQAGQWLQVATFIVNLITYRREEQELMDLVAAHALRSKFGEKVQVGSMGQTIAERIASEAEARGAERAKREALETVLESRFGTLPPDIRRAVAAADVASLGAWLQRVGTASTLAEVGILPAD